MSSVAVWHQVFPSSHSSCLSQSLLLPHLSVAFYLVQADSLLGPIMFARQKLFIFFGGGGVILVLNFPCQYNFPQLFPLEKFSGWLIKLGSRQGQGRCQSMQAVATSWQLLPTIPLFSSSYFSFHNFYINLFGFTSKSIMSSTMSTGGQEPEVKPEIGAWKTHKIYSLIAAQIYLRGNIACGAYPVNTDGPVGARHSKTQ